MKNEEKGRTGEEERNGMGTIAGGGKAEARRGRSPGESILVAETGTDQETERPTAGRAKRHAFTAGKMLPNSGDIVHCVRWII
jgi:hypothetical protein